MASVNSDPGTSDIDTFVDVTKIGTSKKQKTSMYDEIPLFEDLL